MLSPDDHKIPSAPATTHCITHGEQNNGTFASLKHCMVTHLYDSESRSKRSLKDKGNLECAKERAKCSLGHFSYTNIVI